MFTVTYQTKDSHGNTWFHTLPHVTCWSDETSPHDRFTLRVMRNAKGRSLGGPIVGEFTDWQETPEGQE